MNRIRRATLRDLSTLVRFRRGMFEDMGRPCTVGDDRRYRAWARTQMKTRRFVAFLFESAGRVVAGGAVWLREHHPRPGFPGGRIPYLLSVYTEPEYRRRGLATRIVGAAMEWCRQHGYRRMILDASPMGRRVYERIGWKRTWEMKVDLA